MQNIKNSRLTTLIYPSLMTLLAVFVVSSSFAYAQQKSFRYWVIGDLRVADTTGDFNSWLDDGELALRYSSGDEFSLANIGLISHHQILKEHDWLLNAIAQPDSNTAIGVTQLFWRYRPKPKSSWRHQLKAGVFYSPFSLENTQPAWKSQHFSNFSTINSWLAEEVRTVGVEWQYKRLGVRAQSPWDITLVGSVFGFNDTAGALIAWRGWSSHDMQTGLGQSLPLAEFPQRQPGGLFDEQESVTRPFVEVDNRPGIYVGVKTKYKKNLKLSYQYYDNKGNPQNIKDGQYSWHTKYQHLGVEYSPIHRLTIYGQYIDGTTEMGVDNAWVFNDFNSWNITSSFTFEKHQLNVRREEFNVDDRDFTPTDTNLEEGNAFSIAYRYEFNRNVSFSTEYLRWESDRFGRVYIEDQTNPVDANQFLVNLRFIY